MCQCTEDFLCPKAEQLWRDAGAAHHAKEWGKYDRLRRAYADHRNAALGHAKHEGVYAPTSIYRKG